MKSWIYSSDWTGGSPKAGRCSEPHRNINKTKDLEPLERRPLCAVPLALLRRRESHLDLSICLALLGEMLLNGADTYQASVVCSIECFRIDVDHGLLSTLVKYNKLLVPLGNESGDVIG